MEGHGGLITAGGPEELRGGGAQAARGQVPRLRHPDRAAAEFGRHRHPADAGRAGRLGLREGGRGLGRRLHFHGRSHAPLFRRPRAVPGRSGFREGAGLRPARSARTSRGCASPSPDRATPSAEVKAGDPARYESAETTHYSIVDAEGNAVAVTYTLNGSYGSGVTATGLGFLLNNEMDDFAAKPGIAELLRAGAGRGERHRSRASARSPP